MEKLTTRFSIAPTVYVDVSSGRMMVCSPEMYESFVCLEGKWRVGDFPKDEIRKNFSRLENVPEVWAVFRQAMKGVGYL